MANITDWDKTITTVLYGRRWIRTLTAAKQDIATQLLLHEGHHRAQAMAMLRHWEWQRRIWDYILCVQQERETPLKAV